MAAPLKPQKKTANGKDTWWLVPAVADITAPTIAEINSASGLNVTCFMLAEQEGFSVSTSKSSLSRLLCETSTTEGIDTTTWSMPDIMGVFDPQAAADAVGKEFWELVKDGFTGYAVRRQGVKSDVDSDVTAGQFVDVAPVEFGPATPTKTANDGSGIYDFMSTVAITDAPAFNVAVVSGA